MAQPALPDLHKKWHFRVPSSSSSSSSSSRVPLGFNAVAAASKTSTSTSQGVDNKRELKIKRSWEFARSPGMGIFNQLIMMWMSGSSLNIWTIGLVAAMAFSPVKSLMGLQSGFAKYEGPGVDLKLQKLIYVILNLVSLSFMLYKFHQFGLLPSSLDSIVMIPPKKAIEYVSGGYSWIST